MSVNYEPLFAEGGVSRVCLNIEITDGEKASFSFEKLD